MWGVNIPVLGEHIDCRGVVGAVTSIESLHLWHEVEEEAPHPLLVLWKPEEKDEDDQTLQYEQAAAEGCVPVSVVPLTQH